MRQQINFSAIQHKTTYEFIEFKKLWWVLPLVATLVTVAMYVNDAILVNIFIFSAIGLVGSAITKQIKARKTRVLTQFAKDNGWTITQSAIEEDLPPGLRFIKRSSGFSDVISGHYGDIPFKLFEYRYVARSGKNSRTVSNTVLSLSINMTAPYVLLDRKFNNGATKVLNGAEELSLEGDFDKHFTMYAEPHNRIDALSIITPDVMQTMMHAVSGYDIELYGTNAYVYAGGDRLVKQSVSDLFEGAEALLKELCHKGKTFHPTSKLTVLTEHAMKESYSSLGIVDSKTQKKIEYRRYHYCVD